MNHIFFFVWSFYSLVKSAVFFTCLMLVGKEWSVNNIFPRQQINFQLFVSFRNKNISIAKWVGQQFSSCKHPFKLFSQVNSESSEILENLEYVSIQITLLRNECIVAKELNN